MKSPFLILHKAQYDRLKSATSYRIFDNLPEQAEFPYIVMGGVSGRDWSDKFGPGQEVFSTVHIWSQYPGRKEAAEMQDAVLRALTSSPLALGPDFHAVFVALDMSEMIIDIDGTTRHGIVRMKYLIEEV
jgi:hypothetical protein